MKRLRFDWFPVGPALFALAIFSTPFFALPLAFRSASEANFWLVLTLPAWVIILALALRGSSRTNSLVTGSGISVAIGVSAVSLVLNVLLGWLLSHIRT